MQIRSSDNSVNVVNEGSCSWDITVPTTTNSLLYGGVVTWQGGYDFHVSAAGYYINGVFYESPEAIITLDPADSLLNRLDVIYVDTSSTVQFLTGIPSNIPAEPGLDLGTQLGLSVILVEAGTTEPTYLVQECIYEENGEWTVSSSVSIDPASSNFPCIGSVGVEATSSVDTDYIRFIRASSFTPTTSHNVITFKIKPKADWDDDAGNSLTVSFRLSGSLVGTEINISNGSYGFDYTDTAVCQTISIPVADFGLTDVDIVDEFRVVVNASVSFGWYMDGLCLQGGIATLFTDTDEKVKVSWNDDEAGFLTEKITAGAGIVLQELNEGGNESLLISATNTDNSLAYGGVVTWLQNFDFNVTAAGYYLNGTFYESPDTIVTLSASDPTYDRFDVIYLDTNGTVQVLEGTPSIVPAQPGLDLGTQLGLSIILVEAGTTQPNGINQECLYLENAEWTATSSSIRINVDSTNNPCIGLKNIEATATLNGDYFKLVTTPAFALYPDYDTLTFVIKSKGAWGGRSINIRWYNGGVPVGLNVNLANNNQYTFASSDTVNCQIVSIRLTDFGVPVAQVIDELRFTMSVGGGGSFGWYIDGICIQGVPGANPVTDNDIHNQYFGPQTPANFWISGNGRSDGSFTSPGTGGAEKFGLNAVSILGGNAFGRESNSNGGVSMGFQAISTNSISLGNYVTTQSGSIGMMCSPSATGAIALAPGGTNTGGGAINIGAGSQVSGATAVAIGWYPNVSGAYGIGIGNGSTIAHAYSMGIGAYSTSTAANQLILGGTDGFTHIGVKEMYVGVGVTSTLADNVKMSITSASGTDVAGKKLTFAGARGTGSALSGTMEWQTSDTTVSGTTLQSLTTKMGLDSNTKGLYLNNVRFQFDEGSNVASAGDLVLPKDGNVFTVTGTTTINAISGTDWQEGATIFLLTSSSLVLKHNTAGGAGTYPLKLSGSTDFSTTADTLIQLVYKDSYWHEVGRKQASAIGPYTFVNGLTESFGGIVKWGGNLLEDTTINGASLYDVTFLNTDSFIAGSITDSQIGSQGDVILTSGAGGTPVIQTMDAFGSWQLTAPASMSATAGSYFDFYSYPGVGAEYVQLNLDNTALSFKYKLEANSTNLFTQIAHNDGVNPRLDLVSDKSIQLDVTDTVFFVSDNTTGSGLTSSLVFNNNTITSGTGLYIATSVLSSGSAVDINVNSTAAASGGQKALNVSLSGANSNSSQSTYGGYFSNTHSGTSSTNYGIYAIANTGSLNYGVVGDASAGTGVVGTTSSGTGISGTASSGVGLVASSVSGLGAQISSVSNYSAHIINYNTGTNNVASALKLSRETTGTAANGIGYSVEYFIESDDNNTYLSNQLISKWTTAANATRTSQFIISGVNSGVTGDILTLNGNKSIKANGYGVGAFTGTDTYWLAVDASGNIIEEAAPIGIGSLTADNGLTKNTSSNVQLGGTLINATTTINAGTNLFVGTSTFSDATTNSAFTFNNTLNTSALTVGLKGSATGTNGSSAGVMGVNTGSGVGVYGNSGTGSAVIGITTSSGAGVEGRSSSGFGGSFQSTSGIGAHIQVFPSSTNTTVTAARLFRGSTGTAANGIGTNLRFELEASDSFGYESANIASTWTDVTVGTRTGDLQFWTTNSASSTQKAVITGAGQLGLGIYTGLAATRLDIVDNSVAGASIVNISTTSTAAASNTQKGLNISLSGANSNSSESTYGIYLLNTHTGTSSTNYGGYFSATGGTTNYAIWATSNGSGATVYAQSTGTSAAVSAVNSGSGNALVGSSVSGYGMSASSTSATALLATCAPATTNSMLSVGIIQRNSSGTPTTGLGGRLEYRLGSSNNTNRTSGNIGFEWTDATDGTHSSQFILDAVNSGTTNNILKVTGAGIFTIVQGLSNYADDAAAASGGIPVNGLYRNGSVVQIRVS